MNLLRLAPLLFFAVACTAPQQPDTGTTDTDTNTDTDTDTPDDTAAPAPVWTKELVGTSSTLHGVFVSADAVYAVGTEAGARRRGTLPTDTWDPQPIETGLDDEEDFSDLWGTGAGAAVELVATATSGNIARLSGTLWTIEDLGTANYEGVGGSGLESLYAVSWGGIFTFDGATWAYEPNGASLNEVYGIGPNAVAVGEAGTILVRNAEGAWIPQKPVTSEDLNSIAGTGLTDLWAVGNEGTILHSDGVSWTAMESGVEENLVAVYAPAPNAVFAVGSAGTALMYDGVEWTSLPTGVPHNLLAVHGTSATDVWAVGNNGIALHYTGSAAR